MSEKRCPTESELLSFVDADLPPEQLERIEKHLERCSSCAQQVIAWTHLAQDVATVPTSARAEPLDVTAHVASVMERLNEPVAASKASRLLAWSGGLAMAAALLLLFFQLQPPSAGRGEGELVARGSAASDTLTRNVGVQLYVQQQPLLALEPGASITPRTQLTAGLRNVGKEHAFLLLFAVDAQNTVHWIAPEYESEGTDPVATTIAPAADERLLPSAVVFGDLAPGPLRIVALISRTPLHVSDVESLPPAQLGSEALRRRFVRAEVREVALEARPHGARP